MLVDEDHEQDPDRWVSHTAMGREAWQLISQWVWNLRLALSRPLSFSLFIPQLLFPRILTLGESLTQRWILLSLPPHPVVVGNVHSFDSPNGDYKSPVQSRTEVKSLSHFPTILSCEGQQGANSQGGRNLCEGRFMRRDLF